MTAAPGPISKVIEETLERIAAHNPTLNAFITVAEADAMAQAETLDEELKQGHSRGPLHGLAVSVKDLIDVKGLPTTAASRLRTGHVAAIDAPIVSRLRSAGAVIIGKCNLHECALGTTNEESAFGPARNPRDLSRSPGGSSGGSAAAVAAALGWASIGSDTGGSIRIPAAACGVVGLKPTFGELPMEGVLPLSASLDHVGPIGANVRDVWMLFGALAGTGSIPHAQQPAAGFRLGQLGGYFLEWLDPEVRRAFRASVDRLKDAGTTVREVHLQRASEIARAYLNIVLTEAYAVHARTLESDLAKYSPGVGERLMMGRDIPAAAYVDAQRERGTLRTEVDAALLGCDALVLPSLPIPAPKIGATVVEIDGSEQPLRPMMLRLTQLFNLTGHPAISLPCGDTADGLPCGLQLVGRRGETMELLRVALGCEPYLTPRAAALS